MPLFFRHGLVFSLYIFGWFVASQVTDSLFFVGPVESVQALRVLFLEHQLFFHLSISFGRITVALLVTFLLAIPLAMLMAQKNFLALLLSPINRFFRYIPAPVLIPIAIVWFGIGESSKVFILVWGIFFPVLIIIIDQINNIPVSLKDIGQLYNLSPYQYFKNIIWPYIKPDIWTAFTIAWGEAWIYLLIVEMMGTNYGIGKILTVAKRFLQIDQMFGVILLLGGLGYIVSQQLNRWQVVLFPWRTKS